MTNPKIASWQAVFRTIDESGYTIRNMSNTGAALHVTSPVGIPKQFTLILRGDGRHIPCHIVWTKEKRIGVAFD
jgi:hypothetical protein